MASSMRILILGATGMLGYSLFHSLATTGKYEVHGTARKAADYAQFLSAVSEGKVHDGIEVKDQEALARVFKTVMPQVVLNCVGVIKQLDASKLPVESVQLNALLPHQLAGLCNDIGARLVHFSTDCVFSGKKGLYLESDTPDACDLYGRSKLLGEVDYAPHLTLRTSIIGHELGTYHSLVDWFLSQQGEVRGYTKAVFSGLPTIEIARVLDEYILPQPELTGLYHLSVDPIDKCTLLEQVKALYGKELTINTYADFAIDRSLISDRFRHDAGYVAPPWPTLLARMHEDYAQYYEPFRVKG